MKNKTFLMTIGIAGAAGAAMGLLTDRRHSTQSGLIGGAAGIVAASVAAGVMHYMSRNNSVPFYSSASTYYEDVDAV